MRNLFKLKNHQSQKGAAAVEFAIVLPFLALLLFGIIEFSLLLYNQQVITNAAREGVRVAINPIPKIEDDQDIKNIVEDYIFKPDGKPRLISFGNNPDALNTEVTGLLGNKGDNVTVIVSYEYGFLVPGFFNLGPTYDLQSTAVMKIL